MYSYYNINRGNNSGFTVNNLQPWQAGISGNPKGRPKGSRNLKTVIREMLDSPDTYNLLPDTVPRDTSTPLEAIICTLMVKSMSGDVKAADVLLKHAIDKEMPAESIGFFSQTDLKITVVGTKDEMQTEKMPHIDEATGQLIR